MPGADVTAEYNASYREAGTASFTAQVRARLDGQRVLLAPGFLTHLYLRLGRLVKRILGKDDVLDYLREEREALAELGQPADQPLLDRKRFNTQDSVAENASRIVQIITEQRRVILFSHSKGGNDVLAALLLLQEQDALDRVAGWISLQAGFYGSPLSTAIMRNPVLRATAKLMLERTGGSLAGLADTTVEACQAVLTQRADDIRRLTASVPILCFASWKPRPSNLSLRHPDSVLVAPRDFLDRRGLHNDGLVPTEGAILPGTDYIAKVGIDHSETAMTNQPPVQPSRLDRRRMTTALLAMLLRRSQRSIAPVRSQAWS